MTPEQLAFNAGRAFQLARFAGFNGNEMEMAKHNQLCEESLKQLEDLELYDSITATWDNEGLKQEWDKGIRSTEHP